MYGTMVPVQHNYLSICYLMSPTLSHNTVISIKIAPEDQESVDREDAKCNKVRWDTLIVLSRVQSCVTVTDVNKPDH